jgi:hypothetical protein
MLVRISLYNFSICIYRKSIKSSILPLKKKKKPSLNRRKQINRVASSILFSSSIYLLRSDKQTHPARRHVSFRQKLPHPQDTSATIAVLLHIFDQINASPSSTSSPDPNFLFKSTFFLFYYYSLLQTHTQKHFPSFSPPPRHRDCH